MLIPFSCPVWVVDFITKSNLESIFWWIQAQVRFVEPSEIDSWLNGVDITELSKWKQEVKKNNGLRNRKFNYQKVQWRIKNHIATLCIRKHSFNFCIGNDDDPMIVFITNDTLEIDSWFLLTPDNVQWKYFRKTPGGNEVVEKQLNRYEKDCSQSLGFNQETGKLQQYNNTPNKTVEAALKTALLKNNCDSSYANTIIQYMYCS